MEGGSEFGIILGLVLSSRWIKFLALLEVWPDLNLSTWLLVMVRASSRKRGRFSFAVPRGANPKWYVDKSSN